MKRKDWSEAREKIEDEEYCRNCASPYPDPAHIVPRSLGGGQSKDCIIPLCRACHTKYDQGQLDIVSITTLREQLEAVRTLGLERAYQRLRGSA